MDQKFIAGLGNIYVNEILFFCKINPKKKVRNLTKKDMANIIKFSRSVLKRLFNLEDHQLKISVIQMENLASFNYFSTFTESTERIVVAEVVERRYKE